jgi:hypothetical protein
MLHQIKMPLPKSEAYQENRLSKKVLKTSFRTK